MNLKTLLSVLLSFMLTGGLFGQPYTLSGKAFSSPDGMTQLPLEGVRIYSEAPYSGETYTDASGNYTFENIPAGSLMTLRAEKTGYTFAPDFIEKLVNQNWTSVSFTGTYTGVTTTTVPVTFYYKPANGTPVNVYLAGSMNGYNPSDASYKMSNDGSGTFTLTTDLEPNTYVYKFVADGGWFTDPFNPVLDGSEYNNSMITVTEPMITYLLPAFNESYTDQSLPVIKAIVATAGSNLSLSNYSLKINSNAITGIPTLTSNNKVLTYTPSVAELQSGNNTCELTFTVSGKTATKSIQFQYTPGTSGSSYSVSGSVTTAEKLPLSDVTINYGGQSVTTDASGMYSITGIKDATITLIPSKSGYTFNPDQLNLVMDHNYTDQNFTATPGGGGNPSTVNYSISGTVTACGAGVEGVAVDNGTQVFYTNGNGQYTATGTLVYNGTYYEPAMINLTFSKTGYIFNQYGSNYYTYPSATLVASPTQTGQDYAAMKASDDLTGTVSYPDGTPGTDITLEIRDAKTELLVTTLSTDANGNYSYPVIYPPSHDQLFFFTVKPVSPVYSFEPASFEAQNDQTCASLKDRDFNAYLNPVPICMVSTSESGKNIVVWEKPDIDVISGFKVYRESNQAGVYDFLEQVPYSSVCVYEDLASDPAVKAYRYKIGTVTTFSGIETELSDLHKTIHLTINKGAGTSYNLIWSHYEGLDISTYRLYSGTSAEEMALLTEIAGNLNSYTDNQPASENMYYQIEMLLEDACEPEVARPISKSTGEGATYSSTRSNIVNSMNATNGVLETESIPELVYPNPAGKVLYLGRYSGSVPYRIYSLQGTQLDQGLAENSIDITALEEGLYILKIGTGNGWQTTKFMKE
ncbi:MAG: T9SS type A sorting domain-containing protein [Bacteroidota bacterium]